MAMTTGTRFDRYEIRSLVLRGETGAICFAGDRQTRVVAGEGVAVP